MESSFDEVKFLRERIRKKDARLRAYECALESTTKITEVQQEAIREANDARRVSQHYAMKYLREALDVQDVIDYAVQRLNYDLHDMKGSLRTRCDARIWKSNMDAFMVLVGAREPQ